MLINQIRKFHRVEKNYSDNTPWYSIYRYFEIWMLIEKQGKAHGHRFLCYHLTTVSKCGEGRKKPSDVNTTRSV